MKNYTSSVPVETTIARIEKALCAAKVRNVIKDYDENGVVALYFTLQNPAADSLVPVRLPANIESVMKVLREKMKRPRPETLRRLWQQANRTAWKLMQDWVEVQLSLIELQQVEALQVFLPYVWDGKRTYYTALKESGFKLLPQKGGRGGD